MDCAVVDLVAYHFATLEDAERDRVDEHLVGCTACLRAYLAVKRRAELGASTERPSEEARLRLRREVLERFRPTRATRARAWLARPIPLYQGVAAAVLAIVVAAVLPALARQAPPPSGGPYVDSARPAAESLSVY